MIAVEMPEVTVLQEIILGYPPQEIIRAEHHTQTRERYCYYVRLIYGPYHGVEFRCSTEQSALWLFDQVVARRVAGQHWNWMEEDWRQVT